MAEVVVGNGQAGNQNGDWVSLVRGARFHNNGKYIWGFVESGQELMQLLENYRTITGTGFSNAQTLATAMKQIDDTILQQRFMSPASRPRLFWQMYAGEPAIQYDGVPFMSVGQSTELPCVRYGGRRKKVENVAIATGDVIPVDFRHKTGCEGKIIIRRILRYPSAQVSDVSGQGIAAVRRIKRLILEDLTKKIISGVAKPVERYYFLLPTPIAHTGHLVPEVEGSPPLAQAVSDEVINQLSRGITETAQLRDHIKTFVDSTLGQDASLHQDDPSYYPTEHDIFRHVYWLYKTGQVVDQESAFKQSLSFEQKPFLSGLASPTLGNSRASVSNEAITSVYSIIMGDGEGGGGATLELSDNQMQTGQEVELNPDGSSGAKPDDVGADDMTQATYSQAAPVVVAAASPALGPASQARKPYTRNAAAASVAAAKPATATSVSALSCPHSLSPLASTPAFFCIRGTFLSPHVRLTCRYFGFG